MTLEEGKYSRQVLMLCPTCGGDQFSYDSADTQDTAIYTCARCGLQISKDDLIQANSENVQEHVKEIGQEAVKDIAEEFRRSLKNAFRGNKHIRIK